MLKVFLKSFFASHGESLPFESEAQSVPNVGKRVLNVGGNSKKIAIPAVFDGWEHLLLDIDPRCAPDVLCDARELGDMPAGQYDAIYCSHNLEHYYRHDVKKVLAGFMHVLRGDGFVFIRVPDMMEVMRFLVEEKGDIDDVLYQSSVGPITAQDVFYGLGSEIENSGQDFYAHKTGFSEASLDAALHRAGFVHVASQCSNLEIIAFGFKQRPTTSLLASLDLSASVFDDGAVAP